MSYIKRRKLFLYRVLKHSLKRATFVRAQVRTTAEEMEKSDPPLNLQMLN